jgi:hypothetical protein
MLKLGKKPTTTATTTTATSPDPGTVRGRIGEIEAQLEQARQALSAHEAETSNRVIHGEDPLAVEAEAAGLRGDITALESALTALAGTLADAVAQAAGGHLKGYSQAVAHEQAALHKLAVEKLAVAVAALDTVLAEAAAADGRLESRRQESNRVLGLDRTGSEFVRARHLAALDHIGPLRNELERLRFALSA